MIITIDMTSGDTIEEVKSVSRKAKQDHKKQALHAPALDVGLQHYSMTEPSLNQKQTMPESLAKEDVEQFIYKMQK